MNQEYKQRSRVSRGAKEAAEGPGQREEPGQGLHLRGAAPGPAGRTR